ncbi:MAG: DUF2723 domain-containing protein [Anaerolineae bacterium]
MDRRIFPDLLIALVVFLICLGIYVGTLAPGLSYASPDGNELATVAYTLDLAHSTGYPLYTWLGKLFTFLPIGDVAYRVNLMSAALGAAAPCALYVISRLLTGSGGRVWPSCLSSAVAALLFGLSRTFWSQTTIAEVYAPNALMITLTLAMLLWWARTEERGRERRLAEGVWWRRLLPTRRSLVLLFVFGLCFGLSLGMHLSDLGFAPAFALFILLVSPWTALGPPGIASAGVGFVLGLLQFLWLPLRAHTLVDAPMRANAPTTLRGIYAYTLGAFPNFKFAFPVTELPGRIVVYLYFLAQQFGFVGILLGLFGMWVLLLRQPRRFFLLAGMYLVHVWFFIQYRAFDLDVFFIPAHLVYALFIGCGIWWVLDRAALVRRRTLRAVLTGAAALALILGLIGQIRANWVANDRSADTAIEDFYENVFAHLPQDAVLLGRGGVFGYDLFYYRLVYDVRPDVSIPALEPGSSPQDLAGREVYSTLPVDSLEENRGPWAPPVGWVDRQDWTVPVLLGATGPGQDGRGQGLILYHVTDEPPQLVVEDARPQYRIEERVGRLVLAGYDLEANRVRAGGMVHFTLYWRLTSSLRGLMVGTALGGDVLEVHEPGLGNLQRYLEAFRPSGEGVLVEEYRVVVPQLMEQGNLPLEVVTVAAFGVEGAQVVARIPLQEVIVVPGVER